MTKSRWHIITLLICILACMFCSGCGMEETEKAEPYYDIVAREEVFSMEESAGETMVGLQFYQGEAVGLFKVPDLTDGEVKRDLYLRYADGRLELLQKGMKDGTIRCFLDDAGNVYSIAFTELTAAGEMGCEIEKKDKEGNMVYCVPIDNTIEYIGQWDKDELILKILGGKLFYMDANNGRLTAVDEKIESALGMWVVGVSEKGILTMDSTDLWEVNLATGERRTLISCVGSSFDWRDELAEFTDAKAGDDGSVELLHMGEENCRRMMLSLEDISVGKEKLTIRALSFTENALGKWFKERVIAFNASNTKYYIAIEECPVGTEGEDYIQMTNVELGTGKGPDILFGDVLGDSVLGLIEKGGLENLQEWISASELEGNHYFPGAFSCWREGEAVYSVSPLMWPNTYMVNAAVLGSKEVPNAEQLASAMLHYPEKSLYFTESNQGIVRNLLQGSENLWGMVDWENATCNFDTPLFYTILQAAKRCGYTPTQTQNIHGIDGESFREEHILAVDMNSIYQPNAYVSTEEVEKQGMVPFGVLFDDGVHTVLLDSCNIAMNANSSNKEGAWSFIMYLLGEEAQNVNAQETGSGYPVLRSAFEKKMAYVRVESARKDDAVSKTDVEEICRELENAKYLPFRTIGVLDIICEEAAYYFDAVKTPEEVIEVIENRVQLYLEEKQR